MPDVINAPDTSGIPVSVEAVTTLNGSSVSARHLQRFVLALRTAAGVAVDVAGSLAQGILVELSRESPAAAATVAVVGVSITVVDLKVANSARRGLTIYNKSTASLIVKCGASASATSFSVILGPSDYWEMPRATYAGVVTGLWTATDATSGAGAYVTELS